jgi:hypothetical protein
MVQQCREFGNFALNVNPYQRRWNLRYDRAFRVVPHHILVDPSVKMLLVNDKIEGGADVHE